MENKNILGLPNDYFSTIRINLLACGLYLYKKESRLVTIYNVVLYSSLFVSIPFYIRELLNEKYSMTEMTITFGLFIAIFVSFMLVFNRVTLISIFDVLQSGIFLTSIDNADAKEKKDMIQLISKLTQLANGNLCTNEKLEFKYFQNRLKEIVKYHSAIFDVAKQVDDTFNNGYLLVFISLGILFCLLTYPILMARTFKSANLIALFNALSGLAPLLFICYFGDRVTSKSEEIVHTCWDLDLTEIDVRLQKDLILIISRSQKLIVFTAGKIIPLSRTTILAIFRSMYTLYMLIHKFNGRIVIVGAKRTSFGTSRGKFTKTSACDLLIVSNKAAMEALKVKPEMIDTVNFGNIIWGMGDGAGTIIVASEAAVNEYKLTPLARILGYSSVGVDPTIMGFGPVPAIQSILKVCGLNLNQIDLIEVREYRRFQTSWRKILGKGASPACIKCTSGVSLLL
ncbi:hypothetical protein FQA39_LY07876 [Lamprigera yunnana]|nr:hypothetical protein FQA39_LY07876 [Lamprigera yunnana]